MPNLHRRPPSALISWAHVDAGWSAEQIDARKHAVYVLATALRYNGIDADVDLYHLSDNVDWTRWGPLRIDECDFVLVVVSESWRLAWEGRGDPSRGAGAAAEADSLRSIYAVNRDAFSAKVRLVLLPGTDEQDVPSGLHGVARFPLETIDDAALTDLLRNLTEQPEFVRGELGDLPELPPRSSQFFAPQSEAGAPRASSSTASPARETEIPLERRNAVAKAREYLRYTAFSRQGLVRQLTDSEGFSEEDSTFAVTNVGADWDEQATKKARTYLAQMAFSHKGLVDQLIAEGFSLAESELAAAEVNADWREQATKKAREYLTFSSFSRQGLRSQLIFDGFNDGDAEAGAAAAFKRALPSSLEPSLLNSFGAVLISVDIAHDGVSVEARRWNRYVRDGKSRKARPVSDIRRRRYGPRRCPARYSKRCFRTPVR